MQTLPQLFILLLEAIKTFRFYLPFLQEPLVQSPKAQQSCRYQKGKCELQRTLSHEVFVSYGNERQLNFHLPMLVEFRKLGRDFSWRFLPLQSLKFVIPFEPRGDDDGASNKCNRWPFFKWPYSAEASTKAREKEHYRTVLQDCTAGQYE